MLSLNTWNISIMLIFSVACLCWTTPSHAISLHQKLINLQASLFQTNQTLNETTTSLRENLVQLTDRMDRKLLQMSAILDEVFTASSCPENFTRHEGSCYYFSEDLPHEGDRGYAMAMCQMKGSNLVAIETKQEADFLVTQASGVWYWTSGHRHGVYWVWESTGVNMTDGYQPWHTGQPNQPSVYCVFVHGSNGKIYDHPCNQPGIRYICETKIPSCV